jgi:hypothetical protein
MKTNEVEKWIKVNGEKIIIATYGVSMFALGCLISNRITKVNYSNAMMTLHKCGVIKFFNPFTNGEEVTVAELADFLRK